MPEEDRLAKGRGGGEQVVVAGIVERGPTRPPVDHGADESEPGGSFELAGDRLRVGHRQRGHRP
jgi:hypothetical protein